MNKISPHNLESEQQIIGSMILKKNIIFDCIENLNEYDFYKTSHQYIFSTIKKMFLANLDVDLITLTEYLKRNKLLSKAEGTLYITELTNSIITTANIKTHIKIIKDNSILKLIDISNYTLEEVHKTKSPKELVENLQSNIFNMFVNNEKNEIVPIMDILDTTLKNIEKAYLNKGALSNLSTGFYDLDKILSGLQKSQMILIAGRPSMGKTTFALNIAENIALKSKKNVLIFSLEMSKEQLVSKLISSVSNIDTYKLATGELDEMDLNKLTMSVSLLNDSKIFIDDTPNISISEMKAKCKKLMLNNEIDLIVIDYIQLMSGKSKSESRLQEISEISRFIKALSKEIKCPIIALSQLSRAPEQRANHRPLLSDLRESGAIEQDADIVLFLYRDAYYNKNTENKNIAECMIAKHRTGETGTINLAWNGRHSKFLNLVHN